MSEKYNINTVISDVDSQAAVKAVLGQFADAPKLSTIAELNDLRAAVDDLLDTMPSPEGVEIEEFVSGHCPGISVSVPGAAQDKVVLYIHGGGYALGKALHYRQMCAWLSAGTGCRIIALDYPKSPESPYPEAIETIIGVIGELADQGCPPSRIALAGDSAGAGLCLATILTLRDHGSELPAGAWCLCPWSDLTGEAESVTSMADVDTIADKPLLQKLANWYAGDNGDLRDPHISSAFADLTGFPPVLVMCSDQEVFYSDSLALAKNAEEAGAPFEVEIWKGMLHIWPQFIPETKAAEKALERATDFLKKCIDGR